MDFRFLIKGGMSIPNIGFDRPWHMKAAFGTVHLYLLYSAPPLHPPVMFCFQNNAGRVILGAGMSQEVSNWIDFESLNYR